MILCHKCSGLLSGEKDTGLYGCQCISGYIRGFEPEVSLEQAAIEQVKREIEWFALYVSQGRPESWKSDRLARAIKACKAFGHGSVNWEMLIK